jgi:hypothetical protein
VSVARLHEGHQAWTGGDYFLLAVLGMVVAITLYAVWKDYAARHSGLLVTRGETSWGLLGAAFGTIFGGLVFCVVNSDFSGLVKDVLYVGSFPMVAYLCFDNGWFQNKVLGVQVRFMSKDRGA